MEENKERIEMNGLEDWIEFLQEIGYAHSFIIVFRAAHSIHPWERRESVGVRVRVDDRL